MPRACVTGQSPSQGTGVRWSEDFWPVGLSSSQCGHVFANTYGQIYIILKKGEYDVILPWGFSKPVIFMLIYQIIQIDDKTLFWGLLQTQRVKFSKSL